ncbi:hypothetical protein KUCAC02_023348 [Chaenocephalus aceratus]|uniref:Uncharacterized protein n=1 Tax=Chaenocephalus aceratus TaxID=36190 RepID=A0ACB9XRB7_CHAAC|nr:hypothetical protein KUCAC02_023348 [Chaenocephalus aceratus]
MATLFPVANFNFDMSVWTPMGLIPLDALNLLPLTVPQDVTDVEPVSTDVNAVCEVLKTDSMHSSAEHTGPTVARDAAFVEVSVANAASQHGSPLGLTGDAGPMKGD